MTIPSHLTETQAMNLLQDAGIISDNCVNIGDVAREDWERAEEYLKEAGQNE